jgi:hypothetical protein
MRKPNWFPIIIIFFSTIAGALFHKPVLAVEAAINRYETIIEVKNEISNGIWQLKSGQVRFCNLGKGTPMPFKKEVGNWRWNSTTGSYEKTMMKQEEGMRRAIIVKCTSWSKDAPSLYLD